MPEPTLRWFITGTSTGIGRCLARQLLEQGHQVAATARRLGVLDELRAIGGDQVWRGQLDVTQPDQIQFAVDAAWEAFGGIDVVVNNAGYGLFGAAEEVADDKLLAELATNLLGPIRVSRAFIPKLRAQGSGHLIQVGSVGGQIATPGFSSYNASKWGLEGYSEALAQELAPFGIAVTIVEPGGVKTDFAGRSMDMAPAIDAYAGTMQGAIRELFASGAGDSQAIGDPEKVAAAIAALGGRRPAPLRLPLGSDAYQAMTAALTSRLTAAEAAREIAYSTDLTGPTDIGTITGGEDMHEALFGA